VSQGTEPKAINEIVNEQQITNHTKKKLETNSERKISLKKS
jgi:hypothetical protein